MLYDMKRPTEQDVSLLLEWYGEHKRTLPWRDEATPYRVWVSEIMLQQTRVEAAKGYFLRWTERFPTVGDLAAADEEEVLKAWEGLGYYSRARNLHKAAKLVMDNFGGVVPSDKKSLEALPGVGAYTAGAILSIAFGIAEPAVDGNVLRVISRLNADPFDLMKTETRVAVADHLRPLMPKGQTSEFTQSLFELGALICLPNAVPKCAACPLAERCEARRLGKETDYPIRTVKPEKRREKLTVFVVEWEGKFAIRKRPASGLLADLWELPNHPDHLSERAAYVLYGGEISPLPPATHVFTHVVWEMTGYYIKAHYPPEDPSLRFVSAEELRTVYSLPSAFSAYRKYCR